MARLKALVKNGSLVHRGSKYSDDQRFEAVTQYAITGSLAAVERETGIPDSTVSEWTKSEWWDGLIGEVRSQKVDEHIAKYTALVSDAIDYAHSNLDKATPKDALIMAATATDKARLLLNQPTSITGKAESMGNLAQQFQALSKQWEEKQVNVVATVDKSVDNSNKS